MASGNMARAHTPVGTGRSGTNRYVSSALRTAPTSIFSISSCGKSGTAALPYTASVLLAPVPSPCGARWSAPRRAHFHRRTACLSRGRARGSQLLPALAHLVVLERIEQVRRLEHVALAGGAACAAQRIRPRVRPRAAIAIARGAAWPRRAGAASANIWALASERASERQLHMTEHPRTSSTRSTDSCKAKAKAKARLFGFVTATDRFGHVARQLADGFSRAVAARDRR